MKYNAKFFRNGIPAWKKKKDSTLTRLIYRPISFWGASIAANLGISANAVSYFSACVAVVACIMFLFKSSVAHIIGSLLMIIWVILDCIDGNIARCVEKKPFGEFADSISSYILVGFMGAAMGIAAYFQGGPLVKAGNPWIILIGALASSSDTMMRLIYQKYKSTERKMADQGIVEIETDFRAEGEQPVSLKAIIDREFGLGIIPEIVLLASIFGFLDIAVIYCFCFYGSAFVVNLFIYVRKAIKHSSQVSKDTEGGEHN